MKVKKILQIVKKGEKNVKLLSRKCHKSKKENSKKISVKKNDK